jgi:hypothetical protein
MNYWIESIDFEEASIGKAIISCDDHHACVAVYGERDVLTARVIKVVKGLNNEYP